MVKDMNKILSEKEPHKPLTPLSVPLKKKYHDPSIPNSVKVGGIILEVEQISGFEESPDLFGDYDSHKMKIRIVPKRNQQVNQTTFLHELIHAVDFEYYPAYTMEENQVNILAGGLYQAMQNSDFCLNPNTTLSPATPSSDKCFVKKGKDVHMNNCNLKINAVDVDARIVDYEDNNEEFGVYNKYKKTITTSKLPNEQGMQIAFIKSFVNATNELYDLKLSADKRSFLGMQLYQVLKENPICFNQKPPTLSKPQKTPQSKKK